MKRDRKGGIEENWPRGLGLISGSIGARHRSSLTPGRKSKTEREQHPENTLECNHPTFYLAKTPVNRRLGSMRTKIGNSDEESAVLDEEAKIVDKSKTNERLMKEVSRHRRIEFSRKKSSGRDGVRES